MNINFKNYKKTLAATVVAMTLTTGVVLATNFDDSGAGEIPPIVIQVDEHEERIGTLETRTDDIETKTDQNTEDIKVIQESTGIAPAPQVERVVTEQKQSTTSGTSTKSTTSTSTSTSPTQAPSPAPEPAKNKYLVVAVDRKSRVNARYPDKFDILCVYTFEDGFIGWNMATLNRDRQCDFSVGSILQPAQYLHMIDPSERPIPVF